MARLERPKKQTSQDNAAYLRASSFQHRNVHPGSYPKYCEQTDDEVRIKISAAALEYLAQLPELERDDRIIIALAYAEANNRPRIWATDFALLDGCTTVEDVDQWYRKHKIRTRSRRGVSDHLCRHGSKGDPCQRQSQAGWMRPLMPVAPAGSGASP